MKLKINDPAPPINSIDHRGKPIKLEKFKGKKVILYFYPKDDTPGCTAEACNFADNFKLLKKKGYIIIGVSFESPKKHSKFIEKYELPFTLIADEEKKVIKDYGVWGLKTMMGREFMGILRTTFIIDENGIIKNIITKVDNENATQQILALETETAQPI